MGRSLSYETARFDVLLQKLLAPEWAEREAADQLLWRLLNNPRANLADPGGLLRRALLGLPDYENYLQELLGWWMYVRAMELGQRLTKYRCEDNEAAASANVWQVPPNTAYPMCDACNPTVSTGWGVLALLQRLGDLLEPQLPVLIRGLHNPDPVVVDKVGAALCRLGVRAKPAMPAILQLVELGRLRDCDVMGVTLKKIVGDDTGIIQSIIDNIRKAPLAGAVQKLGSLLCTLDQIPPSLLDEMLALLLTHDTEPEKTQELLEMCANLSRKFRYRQPAVRAYALDAAAKKDESWRAAIAGALGQIGDQRVDEALLVALSEDNDPLVRMRAHYAASEWQAPSHDLVFVTAKDLGNYEAHDEQPHYSALNALTQWKHRGLSALPRVQAWLAERIQYGDWPVHQAVEYLEALGADARPLLPLVADMLAKYHQPAAEEPPAYESIPEALADPELPLRPVEKAVLEIVHAEVPARQAEIDAQEVREAEKRARVDALVAEIGIPPDAHIPGTEPTAEATQFDVWERLEAWANGQRLLAQ